VREQLLSLRARRIPVYTVGIGRERFDRDLEVARVDAPRTVLRNASLFVQVVLVQRGFGGARIPVVVEDSGRIVGTATAVLPRDGEAVSVRIRVPATEVGARLLRVKVPTQQGEMIAENNERSTMVVVRDRREKILYVEGEPRFELKFLRRAVEADGNVQLVTLLRSARDKYLRLGVDDSLELAAGFPRTREALFAYRAVVLGSVEASFFTADQLRMLGDFVSERGGGLLVLGGRDALGEGGYGATAVSDALPLELQGVAGDAAVVATLQATPTVAAAGHPALQLAENDSASKARWATLPAITAVNRLGRAKPGATILLTGTAGDGVTSRPLLAYQRYGRGKAIVFAAQDSWLWQMDAAVAVDDQTHETFWRQMLRWLVADVPDRVEAIVADESGPGEGITLRAEVSDSAFLKA
ncbi:MAG TPA: glutamine amidotransferase, partial [Gemmatimonadaceae bacterium]|nr:glutamine amidotransferase [Gemmatimonadaceae bacterium]